VADRGAGGRLAGAFQPRGSLWYQRRRLLQRLEDRVARQAAVIWLLMAVWCAPKRPTGCCCTRPSVSTPACLRAAGRATALCKLVYLPWARLLAHDPRG
jgi:hypothetical protein